MVDMMKNADGMDYPFSDEEFEEVKKSYGSTEGSNIAIAIFALVGFWFFVIFTWNLFDMIYKVICILIHVVACIIWLKNFMENKNVFRKDRDDFRKKTVYLLDDEVKTYYSPKYKGGNFRGVREVDTYHVMVGVLDENGKPGAYIMQVGPRIYKHLKEKGTGTAIL